MANVKIKGINQLEKKLNRSIKIEINKLFRDKDLRLKVGQMIVADIKLNYVGGAPAESTLKWRERYDQLNTTDPQYDRNKIKALFTGELLNDLATNIKADTINKQFVMEHSSKLHKKYQGVTKKIGSRIAFDKLSGYLIDDMGYNYMTISDNVRSEITKLVREKILKLISNI
jgi:hypothetical protein